LIAQKLLRMLIKAKKVTISSSKPFVSAIAETYPYLCLAKLFHVLWLRSENWQTFLGRFKYSVHRGFYGDCARLSETAQAHDTQDYFRTRIMVITSETPSEQSTGRRLSQ
jgi:hypothetical protein